MAVALLLDVHVPRAILLALRLQAADVRSAQAEGLAEGHAFAGIIFLHPMRVSIGDAVRDLLLIAKAAEPADFADRVGFLPL